MLQEAKESKAIQREQDALYKEAEQQSKNN